MEDELKMLRVVRRIAEETPLAVRATFLGAHAVPQEYKGRQEAYIDLIVEEMIPQVAEEGLAQYADVFCETGFFTVADTERILRQPSSTDCVPRCTPTRWTFQAVCR